MYNCCFIFVCLFVVSCCFFQILFHFTGNATEPDCGFRVMGPGPQDMFTDRALMRKSTRLINQTIGLIDKKNLGYYFFKI